jgi:AcrR family transcriptional regulator
MATRRRLNPSIVVENAVELANATSFEAVTLAALAERLGVRIPSLYNHVSGLPGLHYQMSLWAMRSSSDLIRRAGVGKAGANAVLSMAHAYRAFAHSNPGIYRLILRAPAPDEPELTVAAQELLDLLLAALAPYKLSEEAMLHTVRGLRSLMHGFVDLEISGGFALALDRDESFERLVRGFIAGIEASGSGEGALT